MDEAEAEEEQEYPLEKTLMLPSGYVVLSHDKPKITSVNPL